MLVRWLFRLVKKKQAEISVCAAKVNSHGQINISTAGFLKLGLSWKGYYEEQNVLLHPTAQSQNAFCKITPNFSQVMSISFQLAWYTVTSRKL